ncbi:MAG: hypothetical protein RL754_645 [Bacteroidota bacterium]
MESTSMVKQENRRVFSLTKLNESLERLIADRVGGTTFWVRCQIAKINLKNGHRYVELVDSENGKRTAQSRGVIWASTFPKIQSEFKTYGLRAEEVLKDDMEITIEVGVRYHKIYGLSLDIMQVDPAFIIGDIERQKQETMARIEREGLLEMQPKLYLSPIALRIALVGSPGTSGYTDFQTELANNSFHHGFTTKTFEASVQGDQSIATIVSAIREANRWDVDCIVLIRGGGSKMDLHIFNHYDICKAIAFSRVPVLVGVGHETDETLADRVAFRSEKTPTAVAKYLYTRIGVFRANLNEALLQIRTQSNELIASTRHQTQRLQNLIYTHVDSLLKGIGERIEMHTLRIQQSTAEALASQKEWAQNLVNRIYTLSNGHILAGKQHLRQTLAQLGDTTRAVLEARREYLGVAYNFITGTALNQVAVEQQQEISQRERLIELSANHTVEGKKGELDYLVKKIELVDPTALFGKGYTISTVDGTDIQSLETADFDRLEGKTLITQAHNRRVESTITKTEQS